MPATILVVEDNAIILASTALLLTRWGYRVLMADAAPQALQLARDHQGPLDLLLTDLTLDKQSGIDLARELRQLQPALHVVLLTGADQEQLDQQTSGLGPVRVLRKPVGAEQLKACVQEILGR